MNLATAIARRFTTLPGLENPRIPLHDFDRYEDGYGGHTLAGTTVNRNSVLANSAVWRGFNLISGDIARTPLLTYHKSESDGRTLAVSHPLYSVLRWKPNNDMTAFTWLQMSVYRAIGDGNSYTFIERNSAGSVIGLWPLDPSSTYPVRINKELSYVTRDTESAIPKSLGASDVLHFKGFGYDGMVGYSLYDKLKEVFGLGIATRAYSAAFFGNSASPHVVIEYPGKLEKDVLKYLIDQWEARHRGPHKAWRPGLIQDGMKLHTMTTDAEKAQLIESMKFSLVDASNIFGVPPHKLGDSTRAGYNSLEQENESYRECLDPWYVMIEQELRDKLLTESEKAGDSVEIEFNRAILVRTDTAARTARHAAALQNRWMTPNEAREEDGLNPSDEPEADKLGGSLGRKDGEYQEKDDVAENSARRLIADSVRYAIRRVETDAARAAKTEKTYLEWLDGDCITRHRGPVSDRLRVVFDVCGLESERACDIVLSRVLAEYSAIADNAKNATELQKQVSEVMFDRLADELTARLMELRHEP